MSSRHAATAASRLVAVIVLSVAAALSSCQSGPPATASRAALLHVPEPKIVREQFFLYYIRGVWRAMRSRWADAAGDFETSMRKDVLGEDQEQRWIITYGLHRLHDFYPNRELGICKFQLGDYVAAQQYLRKSMSQLPTERARDYLNRTDAKLLSQRLEQGSDEPAPVELALDAIRVNGRSLAVADGINYLDGGELMLAGRAQCRHGITALTVDGRSLYVPQSANGAPPRFEWTARLQLQPGLHEIAIAAASQAGRTAQLPLRLQVDNQHPVVGFLAGHQAGTVQVSVRDDAGLRSVSIDGAAGRLEAGTRRHDQTVVLQGAELTVRAEDLAGNVTNMSLPTRELAALQRRHWQHRPRLMYAAEGDIQLARAVPDEQLPTLCLHPAIERRQVVNGRVFVLDFEAADAGGLSAVEVAFNDQVERIDFGSEPVLRLRQPRRLELNDGDNRLRLTVWDHSRGKLQHEYLLVAQPAADERCDLRLAVKVIAPTVNHIRASDPEPAVNDREVPRRFNVFGWFVQALVSRYPPRLLLLNREPEALAAIREERWYAACGQRYDALRSRWREPDWEIGGYYTFWPDDNWDLTLTATDRRTGAVVMVQDMHFTSFDPAEVKERMGWLAQKWRQSLPIHKLRVRQRQGRTIEIAVGAQHGMCKGMQFAFPDGDEFAAARQSGDELLIAIVTAVRRGLVEAELFPAEARADVNDGDLAIVR